MHCKIIQVSDSKISKKDYIDADTIVFNEEWFLKDIADYVDDMVEVSSRDKTEIIKDIFNYKGIEFTSKDRKLVINDVRDYFTTPFKIFQITLHKLNDDLSLDEFITNKYNSFISEIDWAFDDKYGHYIYYEDDGPELCTIDSFMRDHIGKTFYVGNLLDYHW